MLNKLVSCIRTALYRIKYGNKICFVGVPNFQKKRKQFNIADGQLNIGERVSIKNDSYFAVMNGGVLTLGNHTSFNNRCTVVCHDTITIGDNCAFGPNTLIYDHDHLFGEEGIEPGYKTSPIVIGKNCWIGGNVTILRGTNIGDCCVIGAGTVVKGNIPACSLVTAERSLKIVPIRDQEHR